MSDFVPCSAQSRAPACLVVMGGVCDEAGGSSLGWPLENAALCRVTPQARRGYVVALADAATASGSRPRIELTLCELAQLDAPQVRARFADEGAWARRVAGAFVALRGETGWSPPCGVGLEISSDAPQSAGIGALAALEVAVLSALNRSFALKLDGHQIAQLAQRVATDIVGAPRETGACLTASLGRNHHLLQVRCQPSLIEEWVAPPDRVEFWGISSGVPSARGAAYERAQQAMRLGRAFLTRLAPAAMRGSEGQLSLANISTDLWRALRLQIPERLCGADFAREFPDLAEMTLEADAIYNVRLATEHPIYEADRVARFARLLRQMDENPAARVALGRAAGDLMIQSHFSYDHRHNLGCAQTDLLVELAREAGAKNGIYGARITGVGAGGTVVLMGDRHINADLDAQIEGIATRYARHSELQPQIFRGSSHGANA